MCRGMTPVIQRLAAERDDVVSVNAMGHADVARRFGVMGTSTLVLIRAGTVERMVVGARSERQIRELLT